MPPQRNKPSLRTGLDRDVYQIVRKFENDGIISAAKRLNALAIYDAIKLSNSSLSRQKKRPLEDAIDRVIAVRKAERRDDEDEDSEAEIENQVDANSQSSNKEQDRFLLNRQMARFYNMPVDNSVSSERMDLDPKESTIERQPSGEAKPKRKRSEKPKEKGNEKEVNRAPPTDISLSDLGGIEDIKSQLIELVIRPMILRNHPAIGPFAETNRGFLLHGPPGCGKTTLVRALAAQMKVSYIPVSAPTLVAGMSGESEKKIRDVFEEAKRLAPTLVFFDEIDVIMGKRETAQREMEKRMVAQMGTCMDDLAGLTGDNLVVVFAATNRPDSIDESLRRGGRFETEISMGMPDQDARAGIIRSLTRNISLPDGFDYKELAKRTPGFVGADLRTMVTTARRVAFSRIADLIQAEAERDNPNYETTPDIITGKLNVLEEFVRKRLLNGPEEPQKPLIPTFGDFLTAISQVQPTAKREGFTAIPDTTWAQVGALYGVRKQLYNAITGPIENPERWAKVGITAPSGVLLWGPPGCGKTLLAKAVANEAKANFISIKGPELLNKYLGESERSIRQLFARARQSQPCVLFFDELDSIVPSRDDALADSSHRVVNAMLTELDGIDNRKGVHVIAATNRPDRIDQAVLRPGRLGTMIFVDLPNDEERIDILRTIFKSRMGSRATTGQLEELEPIARRAEGYSGADLENLHNEAANHCLDRNTEDPVIELEDWEYALRHVRRSVQNPEHFRVTMKRALERSKG